MNVRKITEAISIIHGDCIESMRQMEEQSIDVVCTSPVYNLDMDYGTYKDDMPREDYLAWMDKVLEQIHRVLDKDGSFFLNMGASTDPWIDMDVFQLVRKNFQLQNRIVWVKSITVDGVTRGHFKPVNSNRYVNRLWEFVFHFTKTGEVPLDRLAIGVEYTDKSNIARFDAKGDKKCLGNCWFIKYKTIQSRSKQRGKHPATFPPELPEKCILLHGVKPGLTVLDPFVGIGNTLIACKKLGVQGIGIDIDEDYLRTAEKLLGQSGQFLL